jgi:hypothetical protein
MPPSIDYAIPGPLTTLAGVDPAALDGVGADPVEICRPVAGLVIQPEDAQALDLAAERFATNQIRPAGELVRHLLALDPAPVTVPRAPERGQGPGRPEQGRDPAMGRVGPDDRGVRGPDRAGLRRAARHPGRRLRHGRPHDLGGALPARRTPGTRGPDRLTRRSSGCYGSVGSLGHGCGGLSGMD